MTLNSPTIAAPLRDALDREAARLDLALSVYDEATLTAIIGAVAEALQPAPRPRWPWQRAEPSRHAPLLLAGPVGTGKTTLMMLLDRALADRSCLPLFENHLLVAHPTVAPEGGTPPPIQVQPLALMGQTTNIPTGVVRLRQLREAFRLAVYDRSTAKRDEEAAEQFVSHFKGRIVFVDEFVPDTVTSFPMTVINYLADRGVPVVLSSNRRETPFVEGVRVIPVEGEDMRHGDLSRVLLSVGPQPLLDALAEQPEQSLDHVARGLRGRAMTQDGVRWLSLDFENLARTPADWLAFQHLLQLTDRVAVDNMALFDERMEVSNDGARRFVLLVDALYDERRPTLIRMSNLEPLPATFDVERLADQYLPEVLVDIERALSRLRQLASL